jgi:hypothetical protein
MKKIETCPECGERIDHDPVRFSVEGDCNDYGYSQDCHNCGWHQCSFCPACPTYQDFSVKVAPAPLSKTEVEAITGVRIISIPCTPLAECPPVDLDF